VHVTIRKYADKAAPIGGLVPSVRDGYVPLLRRAPGFRGYCAVASEDGHVVSLTVFDDRRTAARADDRLREAVASSLRDLLPNPPEEMAGEALLHEVAKVRRGGEPGMFATVRVFEGVGPREKVVPLAREHVFLTITGAPGFRGYYALLDERDASRGASASLFDTREHAMEANARVVSAMRGRRIAPSPPSVMAGRVVVVAAA
jgi:hypothetical protein